MEKQEIILKLIELLRGQSITQVQEILFECEKKIKSDTIVL